MFRQYRALEIQGGDFAERMVNVAKQKYPDVKFGIGNALDLNQFNDNSFDVVTASFVFHGVKCAAREKCFPR